MVTNNAPNKFLILQQRFLLLISPSMQSSRFHFLSAIYLVFSGINVNWSCCFKADALLTNELC